MLREAEAEAFAAHEAGTCGESEQLLRGGAVTDYYSSVAEVSEAVERVRAAADDDEVAHSEEDALHGDVLAAIAAGVLTGEVAQEAARVALTTGDISFARWYA